MAKTYNEAVSIVDPTIAAGKLPTLWVAFAKMYEANGWFPHICHVFCLSSSENTSRAS